MSRRRMLRGLAGGSAVLVGLPILDAMLDSHGTAFADGEPLRKRIVTWCFGNGVMLDNWVPGGIRNPVTASATRSATRWRRSRRSDYVRVLSGFNKHVEVHHHHHDGYGSTATRLPRTGRAGHLLQPPAARRSISSTPMPSTPRRQPAIVRGVHTGIVTKSAR